MVFDVAAAFWHLMVVLFTPSAGDYLLFDVKNMQKLSLK
jgi:hypothetical protein